MTDSTRPTLEGVAANSRDQGNAVARVLMTEEEW